MTAAQLTTAALALPISDRVHLAQALWADIHANLPEPDPSLVIKEAVRRDEELSSGLAIGRSHDQVMDAARRALKCD